MKKFFVPVVSMLMFAACTQQPQQTSNSGNENATTSAPTEEVASATSPAESVANNAAESQNENPEEENLAKLKLRTNQGEEYERMKSKSWKVYDGVGARNFANSLYMGSDGVVKYGETVESVLNDRDFFEVDEKNGYAHHFEEGAGGWTYDCCYWKGADGKITVALYSHSHDCISDVAYDCTAYLLFFSYNASTKMLDPIEQPFQLEIANPNHMECVLPRKGKDIVLDLNADKNCMPKSKDSVYLLKWNGKGFDVTKTPAPKED